MLGMCITCCGKASGMRDSLRKDSMRRPRGGKRVCRVASWLFSNIAVLMATLCKRVLVPFVPSNHSVVPGFRISACACYLSVAARLLCWAQALL